MLLRFLLWAVLIGSIILGYLGIQSGSTTNAVVGILTLIFAGFALFFIVKLLLNIGFVAVKVILIIALFAGVGLLGIRGCQYLFSTQNSTEQIETQGNPLDLDVSNPEQNGFFDKIKSYFSFSKPTNKQITISPAPTVPVVAPLPPNITGRVSEVRSGYLFKIGTHFIKLYGIDSPDPQQTCINKRSETYDCGRESKRMMERLVLGKRVTCQIVGGDYNENYIATCVLENSDIGASMVFAGWAVADRLATDVYIPYEEEAHKQRKGLWSGRFIAPWDARATQVLPTPPVSEKGFWESWFE